MFPEAIGGIFEASAQSGQNSFDLMSKASLIIGLAPMCGFAIMIIIDELVAWIFKRSEKLSLNQEYQEQDELPPQVLVATTGMSIHSMAEGLSIGGSLFCKNFYSVDV
jgi:zinc transporter ZupT